MRAPASGPFSTHPQPLVVAVAAVLALIPPGARFASPLPQTNEGVPQQTPRPAPVQRDPTQILAGARAVLGDVTRVRTFTIAGHARSLRGTQGAPVSFDIAAELPDRYVRVDHALPGGTPIRTGFDGDTLIQRPASAPPAASPRPDGAPITQMDAMRRARMLAIRQDVARLLLGMFGSSMGTYPLMFSQGGAGDAPEGAADIVEARGAGNLILKFFIYRDSRLPAMVTWPGETSGRDGEHRLIFSDYRDVEGLRLPFRCQRAIGPNLIEETIVERYRINIKIEPGTFDPAR